MSSIQKHVRNAVLGLAVLTLALAPTMAPAAPLAGAGGDETGFFVAAWSHLVDFGERLAAAVGLAPAGAESATSPEVPTTSLLPGEMDNTQCGGDCSQDDSGPTLDPNG